MTAKKRARPRTTLPSMPTIIDKLQILALTRPRALIIVAKVLDGLLSGQLEALDEQDLKGEHVDAGPKKTRVDGGRTKRHRSGSR
jgi:hypothetical protein